MAATATRHPIPFMFVSRVRFWDGGSNSAISGWIKSKMAAGRLFEKNSNGHISAMHYATVI